MKKVLFLCSGNSCRSQMAEAIVNARLAVIGALIEVPVMIGLVDVSFWLQRRLFVGGGRSPSPTL